MPSRRAQRQLRREIRREAFAYMRDQRNQGEHVTEPALRQHLEDEFDTFGNWAVLLPIILELVKMIMEWLDSRD